MKKEEYLRQLAEGLAGFTPEVKNDIVSDIREHFDMRISEGMGEDEISERLGDPKKLAKQFEVSTKIDKAKDTKKGRDISAAILSAAGTGILSFFGVVIPSILGYVLFITLVLGSVSVMATGVAMLVFSIVNAPYFAVNINTIFILVSVGCAALGILMVIGSVGIFRLIKKGILGTLEHIRRR
jgi:uncharacterized membrane protein